MLQHAAQAGTTRPGQPVPGRASLTAIDSHTPVEPSAATPDVNHATGSWPALDGQLCGLFAVDIAAFNAAERDDDIQMYVHSALYAMLATAFNRSGIPWSDCAYEDRGDGALVIVPPTLSAAALVDPIPERLRALVRRHNRVSAEAAQIQLRVAVHIGSVHHDGYGFVGHDVTLLCRLLDARPLKRMLATSGAEVAFITSKYLYDNVIRSRPSLVDPDVFQSMPVRVKETRTRAWAYALGAPPAA
jgi:class 3 adenylate cyclase